MRDTSFPPPPLVDDTVTQDADIRLARDTSRLRKVWDAEKARRGSGMSQKAMALEWGVNPSNVTQYLQGHIKLNVEARLRFAKYLGKPIVEIWPDFEFASVAPGDLPSEAIELATRWAALPRQHQDAVRDLIRNLSQKP